jgi:dUTP pyrophosphatase
VVASFLLSILVGMEISFLKLDPELPTPTRAHGHDGGVDLYARDDVTLDAGARFPVPTGISVAIPAGHAGFVVPRSGLAANHGIGVANGPGLVDSGYRGEIKVILINHSETDFKVLRGDRIAQLVVVKLPEYELIEADELPESDRGQRGFGSSGR